MTLGDKGLISRCCRNNSRRTQPVDPHFNTLHDKHFLRVHIAKDSRPPANILIMLRYSEILLITVTTFYHKLCLKLVH